LGNERANELVKKDRDTPFTGPEPVLGLPYSVVKGSIGDRMEWKHIECWKSSKDCKHSKGPQQGRDTKLLSMSRHQLSIIVGLHTGHLGLYGHLYRIGKDINPLCRKGLKGNKTVEHLHVKANP
jgi:hypothetical protein